MWQFSKKFYLEYNLADLLQFVMGGWLFMTPIKSVSSFYLLRVGQFFNGSHRCLVNEDSSQASRPS